MQTIEYTKSFKQDFKRVKRGRHRNIEELLENALEILLSGKALPARYRDHSLTGQWAGFRDCHIKPDLVLIYRAIPEKIQLVRIGSHSELFD
ncbi:MAG: addiction module toxin RelE [Hyphomicrobium sp. 32-62-53]|nr:MAG: addiction module toxin RelE [Hyphomicrobium sp. 12-62-95]OYX98822.1 MAG: addiction module toxin RelE [Hyphomicrobium sp. 32-62-53]